MVRTISKQVAEGAFGDLLGSLAKDHETVIVEDGGEPIAVVISPDEFNRLVQARAWETIRRVQDRNADKGPEEVLALVTSVVDDVRRERRERRANPQGGD